MSTHYMNRVTFNFNQTQFYSSDSNNYPLTYGTIDNNWSLTSNETSVTLDYIMAMGKYQIMPKFKFATVQDLKTPNDLSLSDHNSVSSKIKLTYVEN